jgi:hypothetical protein
MPRVGEGKWWEKPAHLQAAVDKSSLWAVGYKALGQAVGEPDHARRAVSRIQQNIEDIQLAWISQGLP